MMSHRLMRLSCGKRAHLYPPRMHDVMGNDSVMGVYDNSVIRFDDEMDLVEVS